MLENDTRRTGRTFVVIEKFFCEYRNVEHSDLISRSIGTVTSGIVTPAITMLLMLPRLHMLDNMQLRVVRLNLLNVWLGLDLAVR